MNHICPTCFRPLEPTEEIQVSLDENVVIWKGIICRLTRTEAEVMAVLASGPCFEWKHADQIIQGLYGGGDLPQDAYQTVRGYMKQIRRKLRDAQIPIIIENSYRACRGSNRGYRLKYGID